MEDEYTSYSSEITAIRKEIFTPINKAIELSKERMLDSDLVAKITSLLKDDIPEHFINNDPILYLSRYIATPNFEYFKVEQIARKYGLPLVVGEDLKSTFVGSNELKRKLGKLTVVTGENALGDETFENFTIIDFSKAQGSNICENDTLKGQSLCDFHHELFERFAKKPFLYADESEWVDRNFRDDIRIQYEKMLSLLCTHAIMLESYPPDEHDFLEDVVYPAFKAVEASAGCKPLIVEHITDEEELERDWNAYPKECYEFISSQTT
jgi:hypothetical protein